MATVIAPELPRPLRKPSAPERRLASILAPLPLLALMAWWLGGIALTSSPTLDEVPHVGAGLSYLQKQDLRLNGEHPPLAKVLAAIPLIATRAHADYESKAWTISEQFFPAYLAQWVFGEWVLGRWNDRRTTILLARLPMVLLTLSLAVSVYAIALRFGGLSAGLLCLTLVMSTPMFLSFGPLVLTDIPAALFTTLALLAFAHAAERPTSLNIALFGIALAAALLVKFSCALILLAIPVVLRYTSFRPLPSFGAIELVRTRRVFWQGVAVAASVVYIAYLILSWNQPVDIQHRIGTGAVAEIIGRVLMPGWLYLRGVAMVVFTSSRPAYLFGEVLSQGVPLYFPLLLLLKSTPGFLGILIVSALRTRSFIPPEHGFLWRLLWICAIVFAAVCILSPLNIGFRHFSIPLTLVILLLAPVTTGAGRVRKAVVTLCAVSSIASVALSYPHLLPYANFLTMGVPAYRLIGDSNLDWNQALPEVAKFAATRGLERVRVDTYGLSDPSSDLPQAFVWDCQAPSAADAGAVAIVSANALLESHNCKWLLPYLRQSLAGGSMYVVELPATIPPIGSPDGPPSPADHRRIFGLPLDMRALTIDVTNHPEKLPEAFAELERKFAADSLARDLYPPDQPVRWPWQRD